MRTSPKSLRLILATLLAIAVPAVALPSISSAAAPDVVKLVIHYQRPAGDYTGWNLWLWKNSLVNTNDKSLDTKGVQFNGSDDFGKVLTLEVPDMNGFEDIGILVRLNAWASKDIVVYTTAGKDVGNKVVSIVVIHNPNATAQKVKLPKASKWSIVVSVDKAGTSVISSATMSEVSVAPQSTMVLQQ